MQSVSGIGRIAALGAVVGAIVLVAIVLFGGGDSGYKVTANFVNASQLVKGNLVQVAGTQAGAVDDIKISPDGQAEITLSIKEDFAPLREGTTAVIRQASLSGIANRYVDLTLPSGPDADNPPIDEGGEIEVDETTAPVELDQLFNTFDPLTRVATQDFLKGSARQFRGRGEQANVGYQYLNPALSTSSRLFRELNKDTPVLEAFLVDSARLVTTLAERRDDLAALIGNLNATTRALGNEKLALAEAIARFPDFMRTANTTFVNLRSTLDTLDPLVNASKPVVSRPGAGNDLQELLPELRRFTADAEPTVADLQRIIRKSGANNDLINLTNTFPPLESAALERKPRSVSPGGRSFRVNGGDPVRGAFPEMTEAFEDSVDEIADQRPYSPDLLGWFDDFSTTGGGQDALAGISRTQVYFNAMTFTGGIALSQFLSGEGFGPLSPLIATLLEGAGVVPEGEIIPADERDQLFNPTGSARDDQYKRCPGASEEAAGDGSNVLSAGEQNRIDCNEDDRATGDVP
jgi:phospholipid/cholesterol/gamma-HCH transport system substrate-binding protein